MPAARFFVPIVAPSALILLACATRCGSGALLPTALAATVAASVLYAPRGADKAAEVGSIIGKHIEATWPRDIAIALNTAGSTPFFASEARVFIDMLGLNDPVIAKRKDVPIRTFGQLWPGHGKGDGAYVLARAPERIILGPAEGTDARTPWFLSDAELADSPAFHRCYEKVVEEIVVDEAGKWAIPGTGQCLLFTWYRRTCPKP